ncbi:MAG: GSCFA domain-containing protein [Gelidibacter sp.]|nr:GSCFA domain-containing protein [Gelidibacter sp.]
MKLQTQIPLKKQENNQIDYQSKTLLLGSCFVENIGNKLAYFKFHIQQNPFGILFHPKAIETLVSNAIYQKAYTETDIFYYNEQWHCFDVHSKLSNASKEKLLLELNTAIKSTHQYMQEATHIIMTLGTAWVYGNIKQDAIVANCHKIPQKAFAKKLLSVDDISKSLDNCLQLIKTINPKATIIFTVSPIRHIKDGFIENTQSKAHLITAIHQITNHQFFYFPSYEIMLDELRDYRFYAEDMLHPNQTAIHYIWEKFQQVWMSPKVDKMMQDIDTIQKGFQHQPFNPNSEAHQKFLHHLEVKKSELQSKFPHITF